MAQLLRLVLWCLGFLVVACAASPAAPDGGGGTNESSAVVVTWSREGGFAGFCDELKVTAAGDTTATSCRGSAQKTGRLAAADLARLGEWRNAFGAVSVTSSDSGTADGMTLKLTLAGKGSSQPSAAQRQELLDWAQRVYTQTAG